MQKLTNEGQALVTNLSQRYNLSQDAIIHMMAAVNNGGGSMAQFNCPELGGGGQWMRGGMTMVGDMFNHGLQATVDSLCNELANGLANTQVYPVVPAGTPGSNQWWPQDLGTPFSSGGQNNTRYAVFAGRLAVQLNDNTTVYDTLDHQIGGVSQQQGGDSSLTFSSQYGTVPVSSLPIISGAGLPPAPETNFAAPPRNNVEPPMDTHTGINHQGPDEFANSSPTPEHQTEPSDEIFALIGKLKQLHDAGVLTDEEFGNKKAELLERI